MNLAELTRPHAFRDSVTWRLGPHGITIWDSPETTKGAPDTARHIWRTYRELILYHAEAYKVPPDLILATIATESGGDPAAERQEPGYVSDAATPHRISLGLTQTLISTARWALRNPLVDREFLLRPEGSIQACAAVIDLQEPKTGYDPPAVAAAYNAGGVYYEADQANRWRMRCYPLHTGRHVDHWIRFFNDVFRVWALDGDAPPGSLFLIVREAVA